MEIDEIGELCGLLRICSHVIPQYLQKDVSNQKKIFIMIETGENHEFSEIWMPSQEAFYYGIEDIYFLQLSDNFRHHIAANNIVD